MSCEFATRERGDFQLTKPGHGRARLGCPRVQDVEEREDLRERLVKYVILFHF
jgi:hypothetical protein